MKGLYVYGALLMGMCAAIGLSYSSSTVVGLALVAAASAALSEALHEAWRTNTLSSSTALVSAINITAIASWGFSALAAVSALLAII